jgi:hypothetical protein
VHFAEVRARCPARDEELHPAQQSLDRLAGGQQGRQPASALVARTLNTSALNTSALGIWWCQMLAGHESSSSGGDYGVFAVAVARRLRGETSEGRRVPGAGR